MCCHWYPLPYVHHWWKFSDATCHNNSTLNGLKELYASSTLPDASDLSFNLSCILYLQVIPQWIGQIAPEISPSKASPETSVGYSECYCYHWVGSTLNTFIVY